METNNGGEADLGYKECLRNHALPIRLFALDGCGGFVTEAEEGTPEALFCAACNCHRNYHRREAVQPPLLRPRRYANRVRTALRGRAPAFPALFPPPPPSSPPLQLPPPAAPRNARSGRVKEVGSSEPVDSGEGAEEEEKRKKKKPKTKFTEAQRVRMREFAEKMGWRPMKHDEEEIESFCEEIGIEPPVYKVWINNNRRRFMETGEPSSAPKKN